MKETTVLKIRDFNRFYLSVMDFYVSNYLGGDYSITESRVLFEIYDNEECHADYIVKRLHLDKGYLSRLIKRFEGGGLLKRQRSKSDARLYKIFLTPKGKLVTEELIEKSNREIGDIIKPLSDKECLKLEKSMDTIKEIFGRREAD